MEFRWNLKKRLLQTVKLNRDIETDKNFVKLDKCFFCGKLIDIFSTDIQMVPSGDVTLQHKFKSICPLLEQQF